MPDVLCRVAKRGHAKLDCSAGRFRPLNVARDCSEAAAQRHAAVGRIGSYLRYKPSGSTPDPKAQFVRSLRPTAGAFRLANQIFSF